MTDLEVLPITQYGNSILRLQSQSVPYSRIQSADLGELVQLMFYTMEQVDGVGLAAPQIGKSIQLAVIAFEGHHTRPDMMPIPKTILINPRIVDASDELVSDWEGCLSFSGATRRLVNRHKGITVEYMNDRGNLQTAEYHGFTARVFQHEIDHLMGMLYIDRISNEPS